MIAAILALAAASPLTCHPSISRPWNDHTQTIGIDGMSFRRIRGRELRTTIAGHVTVPPDVSGLGHQGSKQFLRNGTYIAESNRGGEFQGRWSVARDVLWMKLSGQGYNRWMLFRSSDGSLAANVSNEGCMETRRLRLQPVNEAAE